MKKLSILLFLIFSVEAFPALSDSVCANLVVTEIKTINTALSGAAETEAIAMWTAICKGILDHIKTSADINLSAGDITVPSLGLFDSLAAPVTGTALIAPVLLSGKIQ